MSSNIILRDNDPSWVKNPTAIRIGEEFSKLSDMMANIMRDDDGNREASAENLKSLIESLPKSFFRHTYQSSEPGGNDAMNPVWQFCEYDDVPAQLSDNGVPGEGVGRVYDDMYNRNQQILWMTFGVPQYSDPTTFFSEAASSGLSHLMNTGEQSIPGTLGRLLGKTLNVAFKIPLYPIIWIQDLGKAMAGKEQTITEYCSLKNTQLLYLKGVNSLLTPLAVSLGILPNGIEGDAVSSTGASGSEVTLKERYDASGLPGIMKHGPDILSIMTSKARRRKSADSSVLSTDQIYEELMADKAIKKEPTAADKFADALAVSALDGAQYIGFRVEKGSVPTETFSNTAGPSAMASTLNNVSKSKKDKKFMLSGLKEGDGILGALASVVTGATDFAAKAISELTGFAGAVELASGNGYFALPEMYLDSKFSTSFSMSLQLRARAGDPVSVFQSVYIPLCCWIAAVSPRAIGANMYTSPFLFRAYSKGQVSIPFGLVESLSIKRGVGEFGWSRQMLPTAIDLDISLRNLNPALFMTIGGDNTLMQQIFAKNSGMSEYLTTLSGIGLYDRESVKSRMALKFNTMLQTLKLKHSPTHYGMGLGDTTIAKLVAAVGPWKMKVPRN